jgi:N-acetylneuraminic acid mutarotase
MKMCCCLTPHLICRAGISTLLSLLVCLLILSSCKKEIAKPDESFSMRIDSFPLQPQFTGNYWTFATDHPAITDVPRASFIINDKLYVLAENSNDIADPFRHNQLWVYDYDGLIAWSKKASLPSFKQINPAAFAIDANGYFVSGTNEVSGSECWQYNSVANKWLKKANFPGNPREYPVGFTINYKGYIATGSNLGFCFSDLWEYDRLNDSWTQKASIKKPISLPPYPNWGRAKAFAFVIGSKAYVGAGVRFSPTGDEPSVYLKDFWEYAPSTNKWTQKADFPGGPRAGAAAFSLNGIGYAGTGYYYDGAFITHTRDFWAYNPANDDWTKKADYEGFPRRDAIGVAMGGYGYIGLGGSVSGIILNNIYRYTKSSPIIYLP